MSCIVMQEEKGQTPVEDSDAMQSRSEGNATDNCIVGDSGGREEKAGQIADSVQSIENRNFYETEEEKLQFICDSFQLDENKILKINKKLKEAVIELFVDHFEVLATHLSQYGETKVL